MNYKVKDLSLAEKGRKKVEWARSRMPVMNYLKELYQEEKPLKDKKIAGCVHGRKKLLYWLKH